MSSGFDLSDAERMLLVRLLEAAVGDLRVEIRHTRFSPTFKDNLESDRDLMQGMLDRLRRDETPQAAVQG